MQLVNAEYKRDKFSLAAFGFMYFDVLIPAMLFSVTFVAMFLGNRAESKVKSTFEEREFKTKDTVLFVAMIALAISILIFVPSMAIVVIFLFAYSSLLFIVSYTFSDMRTKRMVLFCSIFMIASVLAGVIGFLGMIPYDTRIYGISAFAALAIYSLISLLHARRKSGTKKKWYLAALPPVLFLLLFFFFNDTNLWFPYLLDIYGILFAVLIIIYLAPIFNWKIIFGYAAAITILDIVLVWGTGTMIQAAEALTQMHLPVMVWFPTVPPMFSSEGYLLLHGLGLGDLFFSGILSFQTMKKFGKRVAVAALVGISISFGLFELIILNPELASALPVRALPATLPIILGWLLTISITLAERKRTP